MQGVFKYRDSLPGPLIIFQDNSFLTRSRMKQFMTQAISEILNVYTHSFRIGEATALAHDRVTRLLGRLLGRLVSDCFKIYLRSPRDYTCNLTTRMVNPHFNW